MNLYRLSQAVSKNYDTYDSAVVCAKDEEAAKKIHPTGWCDLDDSSWERSWARPDDVTCLLLGTAAPGLEEGVVCASFNAG